MQRRSIRVLAAFFGVIVFLLSSYSVAHAQSESQVITASPASVELSVDPGGSVSRHIDILNAGDDTFTVKLSTAPYYVTGLSYDPRFTQLPGTLNASEWIILDATSEELESNKKVRVEYTVAVPENTPPGGYYAVIFAETAQENISGGGVVPRKRVGSLVYITVNGEVKKSGSLTGGALPSFSFAKTIPLMVRVANDGGIHFTSAITFLVTNAAGKEVYKDDLERIILPSTEREIASNWAVTSPVGIYTVHREVIVADELVKLDDQKIIVISPWFLFFLIAFISSTATLIVLRAKQRKRKSE